jgi:flagellar biosynthesis component FlhA
MPARVGLIGSLAALLAFTSVGAAAGWHVTKAAKTQSYAVTLEVGPMESMYTEEQAKESHPATGEVMLGTGMSTPTGGHAIGMEGGPIRQLDVRVRARSTGAVLGGLKPTIALRDVTAKSTASAIQAIALEGIDAGPADLHYGNDVMLQPGHRYEVLVGVKGQHAAFTFRAG